MINRRTPVNPPVAPVEMATGPRARPALAPVARPTNHTGEPGFRPSISRKVEETGPMPRPASVTPKPRVNNHAGEPGFRAAQGAPKTMPKTAAARATKAVTNAVKASKAAPTSTVKGSKLVAEARAAAAGKETRAQHQQLALERMLKSSRKG